MYNKIYVKHLFIMYLTRLGYVTLIFSSLIFIMNILEELKFFSDNDRYWYWISSFINNIKFTISFI